MRLSLSLLAAVALHGALFGVAAAILSRAPARAATPVPVEVDVELIAPRPDPIADSAPSAKPTSQAPSSHIARRVRHVALVERSPPAAVLTTPSGTARAPAASTEAPSVSPAPLPAAVRASAAPSRGAVVSATPRYRSNPRPDYPIPSLRRGEEGIVLLNVQVGADGTPAAVSLNRSCGHPLLDRAALDAVRRWTFEPARAAGLPVSSSVVIPVRFSLAEQP